MHDDLSERVSTLEAKQVRTAQQLEDQAVALQQMLLSRSASSSLTRRLAASSPATPRDQLVAWVSWLVDRYELGAVLPSCWPKHGQLVEELDALWEGWRETVGAGKGGVAAMSWHDFFARALDRIESGRWNVCRDGVHRSPIPTDWLTSGPEDADGIDLDRDRFDPWGPG